MNSKIEDMLEIYFVSGTQDVPGGELLSTLEEALKSGITCFQYREKGRGSLAEDSAALEKMAIECQRLCKKYHVPFIINDYVELAVKIQADGVHVGQKDKSILETIQKADDLIIGYSTNTLKQAMKAQKIERVSYIGVGPVFQTSSKQDAEAAIGTAGLKTIMTQTNKLPAVAIGGISEQNAEAVWDTGVEGVAVISAITKSSDMPSTIAALKKKR